MWVFSNLINVLMNKYALIHLDFLELDLTFSSQWLFEYDTQWQKKLQKVFFCCQVKKIEKFDVKCLPTGKKKKFFQGKMNYNSLGIFSSKPYIMD